MPGGLGNAYQGFVKARQQSGGVFAQMGQALEDAGYDDMYRGDFVNSQYQHASRGIYGNYGPGSGFRPIVRFGRGPRGFNARRIPGRYRRAAPRGGRRLYPSMRRAPPRIRSQRSRSTNNIALLGRLPMSYLRTRPPRSFRIV